MAIARYLHIIYILLHFVFGSEGSSGTYIRLDKYESCEDAWNAPIVYHPAQIYFRNDSIYVNYNITSKRNLNSNLEVTWIIEKCASKESLNTCQQFYKMRSSRFCQFIGVKGEVWTSFIDCTTPRLQCPFRKGTYVGKNCKLDLSVFKLFPMSSNSYWRPKMIISDSKTKARLGCAIMAGGIANL